MPVPEPGRAKAAVAWFAPVFTVRELVAGVVPDTVTVAGVKLQAAPAGRPEHASAT
jgi:hypothetical protein